jgi:hypothetical protein
MLLSSYCTKMERLYSTKNNVVKELLNEILIVKRRIM